MPNTKSAVRRGRNSARKHLRNNSIKSGLKTVEQRYLATLPGGNKDQAAVNLRSVSSALDKAAKSGVIHKSTASRKKSRLAIRLNAMKTVDAGAPAPASSEPATTPQA